MQRKIYKDLLNWKNSASKKPLLLDGARQTGKTYILKETFRAQDEILQNYENDISKHADEKIVPKINLIWNSIPLQLAKENKKFIYGAIRKGARAAEYESAIQWLL